LYRWVEQAFGGRDHELTVAYGDAAAVVAGLDAVTEAVLNGDEAAAAAAVEEYLLASAHRMLMAYNHPGAN
jgi:GntR family transcriptional repressor for pyruvate dehydrogenase complex